jgi:predicted nucleic acid-binding protein
MYRRANPIRFAVPAIWPDLGPGECSVLMLALESTDPVLLILDDLLARRLAAWKRLRVTGTAGILLRAKRQGILPSLRPCLDKLVETGFYLKQDLIDCILELANET